MAKIKKTISGLKPDTNYIFTVKPKNTELSAVDTTPDAIRVRIPSVTSIPSNITDLALSSNFEKVMFAFNAVNDVDFANYEYELYDNAEGTGTPVSTGISGSNVFVVAVTNSTDSTTRRYWGRVRAVNTSGINGEWTALISDAATPLLTEEYIASLTAAKITAGTISSAEIILSGSSAVIKSSNYAPGNNTAAGAGWIISGNGSAIFNDVTIRDEIHIGEDAGFDDSTSLHANNNAYFWIGANRDQYASAPFRVSNTGDFVAANANIAGTIAANAGNVGGWTINTSNITSSSGNTILYNNGYIQATAGKFSGQIEANSGNIGGWTINSANISSGNTILYSNGTGVFGNTTLYTNGQITNGSNFTVYANGVLSVANAVISGAVTATIGSIGGWTLAPGGLFGGATVLYSNGQITNGSNFSVSNTGILSANSVTLSGNITANAGSVGGFTISANTLSSGTGSTTVGISSNTSSGNIAFWTGATAATDGLFKVYNNGLIFSNNADLGGFLVNANAIYSIYTSGSNYATISMYSNSVGYNRSFGMSSFTTGGSGIQQNTLGLGIQSSEARITVNTSNQSSNTASSISILSTIGTSSITLTANSFTGVAKSYSAWYIDSFGGSTIYLHSNVNGSNTQIDGYGNISILYYNGANDANTSITVSPYRTANQGIKLVDNYPVSIPGFFPYTLIGFGTIEASSSITSYGTFLSGNGSAGSPSYTFNSDTDTGIYRKAANQIGFATTGIERLFIGSNQIAGTLPIRLEDGTVTAPSFAFSNNTNTGMYASSTAIAFALNGAVAISHDSNPIVAAPTTTAQTTTWRVESTGFGTYYIKRPTSLAQYKENISDIPDALAIMNSLRPRQFTWIPPEDYTDEQKQLKALDINYGFVVEEVLDVDHKLVEFDCPSPEDWEQLQNWTPMMWKEQYITALSVRAIQQLNEKIEDLEARLNAL